MAVLKTARTLVASTSVAAGGTHTQATPTDLTTALGLTVTAKVTNGATGPTIGCTTRVEVSNDNTAFKTYAQAVAGTTASTTYEFTFEIPPTVMYVRMVFTGHTGQAVTVEAFGHELTTV